MGTAKDSTRQNGDSKPFRGGHTPTQWGILAASILVILGCFAGAVALVWGKHEREQFQALEAVDLGSGSEPVAAPPSIDGSTSTQAGQPATSGQPTETFPPANPEAKNYLIAAADNHACVDPNSPWAGAADPDRPAGDRSDTIMLIRVDPTTKAAAVLSFPRDLWIKRSSGGMDRINAAYTRNDQTELVKVLKSNFNVPVDHYVQVDFCAFKTIVDAVGGVGVPFVNPIKDPEVGLHIDETGVCHVFSGDEALAYVRSRYLEQYVNGKWTRDGTSDLGRISRQQDFLTRTMRSALSKGTFNPSVARGLLRTFQNGDLITDQGFSIDEILGLAGLLSNINPESLLRYQVEGKGQMNQGKAVIVPTVKNARMQAVFDIFRGKAPLNGTAVPEATTASTDDSSPTTVATSNSSSSSVGGSTTEATSDSTVDSAPTNPEQIIKGEILPDPNIVCS